MKGSQKVKHCLLIVEYMINDHWITYSMTIG